MKKLSLLLLSVLFLGLTGCSEEKNDPTPQGKPSIALEAGATEATSLTFKATIANATQAAYMVLNETDEVPALSDILNTGNLIDLRSENPIMVEAKNLLPATSYRIVAAATNGSATTGSNTLYMETVAQSEMTLSVEIVQKDHEKMNFRVKATNAERLAYLVLYASKESPEASYVMNNGTEIAVDTKESIEVTGLESNKEYKLYVVAQREAETLMADPVSFKTDDDPTNVISHTYTRAKGSCLSSGSAFVQFSYEDPNEADNFAYDDQWMGLDIRLAPNSEYVPAGEYTVTNTAENGTIFSRYSTYGYGDIGIQIETGTLNVTILEGEEIDYYRFEADLYLINGRHVVATYEGEVSGMPIQNTITINTTFTTASAVKKADDGSLWQLTLSDANGQSAVLDCYNSFPADYLAANTYTISTSSEATNSDFEPGEFDGTTSTFTVVGGVAEGTHLYNTGSLHVTIDWQNRLYMMSFYGSLVNGAVVEGEFMGPVEGISLAPSTEKSEVTFTAATASSLDNGAYWNVNMTNEEGYEVRFSAECDASPNGLPSGSYIGGVGKGRIDLETAYIKVPGEQQYYFTAIDLTVSTDLETKTYLFELEGKVEDGRTFLCTFNGEVEGMEVVPEKELLSEVTYATASANGYSSWWTMTLENADKSYQMMIDLRSPDSTMIGAGTYEPKEDSGESFHLMTNYCKLTAEGTEYDVEDGTVIVTYDESTQEYTINHTLTLANGKTFSGNYSGPIAGSPKSQE